MKEGLNGKPIKVAANLSPFIQHIIVENILYDESAPAEEYLIVRILRGSHIWDPGGSYRRRRRNLEGKQNIAYEGTRDLNVAYKGISDHLLT